MMTVIGCPTCNARNRVGPIAQGIPRCPRCKSTLRVPSYRELLPRLHEIVKQSGGDPDTIQTRRVESPLAAIAERFLGSPTVRVDGHGVAPDAADRSDYALTCRIYRTDTG